MGDNNIGVGGAVGRVDPRHEDFISAGDGQGGGKVAITQRAGVGVNIAGAAEAGIGSADPLTTGEQAAAGTFCFNDNPVGAGSAGPPDLRRADNSG